MTRAMVTDGIFLDFIYLAAVMSLGVAATLAVYFQINSL